MDITSGKYFRGYLQSDALNVDTAIPLFDENGIAITLAKGERPVIYELLVSNGATTCAVTVYADTNGNAALDAGEELARFTLAANGQGALPSASGFVAGRQSDGATKNKLRAVASVASVGLSITIIGHIINS